MHPVTWPIVTELTRGRPRLVSGTLRSTPRPPTRCSPCGCTAPATTTAGTRSATRCATGASSATTPWCSPYLTDVHPGDGGLVVVPGSHKSLFERPPELFNNGVLETLEQLPAGNREHHPRAPATWW